MRASDILIELIEPKDGAGGEYRTVSERIEVGRVRVPVAQERITARWRRELQIHVKNPGDVDSVYSHNIFMFPANEKLVESVFSWLQKQGLPDLREQAQVNVVGCKAAHFHHDISGFSDSLFCVVWLEEARGLDLVFPESKRRIPLEKGTVVLFDAAQPHGVIHAHQTRYYPSQYVDLPVQAFMSVDFAANLPGVVEAMGIRLLESADTWHGVLAPISSDGPDLNDRTGKWLTKLPSRRKAGPAARAKSDISLPV